MSSGVSTSARSQVRPVLLHGCADQLDALYNLLRNTSVILNPNALYELASRGIPSFAETMTDAKMVRASLAARRTDWRRRSSTKRSRHRANL